MLEDDYSPAARMERAKARRRSESMDSSSVTTPKQSPRSPALSERFNEKFPKNLSPRNTTPRASYPVTKVANGESPRYSLDKDLVRFFDEEIEEWIGVGLIRLPARYSSRISGRGGRGALGFGS